MAECLASEYGVPYAKLEARLHDPKVLDVLPREYIEQESGAAAVRDRGTLTLAVAEPTNLFLIEEIRGLTHLQVQIVAATCKDIRRMLTALPNSKVFVIDDIIEDSDATDVTLIEEAIEDIGDVEEIAGQSPVIRLVNYVIYHAVKEGASDIHVEPADRCMRVRYRIDGRLYKSLEVPQHLLNAVTSRIKIMASMDISERRLPQDGRVHVMLDGRKIDLRVSTFPGNRGEKTVIRVLDTRSVSLNLEDLGFAEDILTSFRRTSPRLTASCWSRGRPAAASPRRSMRALNEHQLDGEQRLHGRRSDRIPLAADQPVSSARESRADLLQSPADPAAARSRCDHGGRSPRRGNGPHRHSSGTHRPPGL